MLKPRSISKSARRKTTLALATALATLAFASSASAFQVVSERGEGPGQTNSPLGMATDSTGRLFVADWKNFRVDVFDPDGEFEMAFGWGVANGSNEFQKCTTVCRAGISGSGPGQFTRPSEIAIDPLNDALYVLDTANKRIQKFANDGSFLLAFGGSGQGEGKISALENTGNSGMHLGVGPTGLVYLVDTIGTESHAEVRLQKFEPSGTVTSPQHVLPTMGGNLLGGQIKDGYGLANSIAVKPNGEFYVSHYADRDTAEKGPISRFDANGALAGPVITSEAEIGVLSVDWETGELYAASSDDGSIAKYDSSGTIQSRFGYGFPKVLGLASYVSATGDIYAAHAAEETGGTLSGGRILHIDLPAPGPIVLPKPCGVKEGALGNIKATLRAEVNPEGKETSYRFQYISDSDYVANGNGFIGPNQANETLLLELKDKDGQLVADFESYEATAKVEGLVPETKYHCRVIATNTDAPGGVEGSEGAFTTLPPLEIVSTWSSDVGSEAATLNASVKPFGVPNTTGYFQYVDEATYQKDIAELGPGHGFDHAKQGPDLGKGEEPLDFGSSESEAKTASVEVGDLLSGTTYRYRLIATDLPLEGEGRDVKGSTQVLRTYVPGEDGLADGRRWELVSPGEKNSAEVAVPGAPGGLLLELEYTKIQAASASGDALTYASWTSFGDGASAPGASQYLSRRNSAGWSTENVSPAGVQTNPVWPPYRGFSPDLSFSAFVVKEPPLTAEAQADFENLYLRDNETGTLQALTVEQPHFTETEERPFCAMFAGASIDGERAFFAANGAMAGAPTGPGFSLYEWSKGEGLKLVSVLPNGSAAQPQGGTRFGAEFGLCKSGHGNIANAVSADGSIAFWSYSGNFSGSKRPLFARINGSETVQLDAKPTVNPGKGPFGEGQFWAATPDGSQTFFTAPGLLTKDAKAGGHLYRYDTEARALTDLTAGEIALNVSGVFASEDGDYVYFIANGVLTGEAENAAGQKAQKGASNLYLYHEGEGLRFVSMLDNPGGVTTVDPSGRTARITPDGRHFVFLANNAQDLAGYDNTVVSGSHCESVFVNGPLTRGSPECPEAFIYDAEADELTCVSCNPTGSRPLGPTDLPTWSNPFEGPRALSDDGQRLFFESRDALSLADENEKRDVYEFERADKGNCTTQSPTYSEASGGCITLISTGKGSDESYLVDASADGRDVFFSTRSQLVGWDENENYDVYDAREGGGFPEPSPASPNCEGEGCKPAPTSAPTAGSSPGTVSFQGPGNQFAPSNPRCRRGAVRRGGRCRKPRKHASKQHRRKAHRNGRPSR